MDNRNITTLEGFLTWRWNITPVGKVDVTNPLSDVVEHTDHYGAIPVTFNQFAPLVGLYERYRNEIECRLPACPVETVDSILPELIKVQAREYVRLLSEQLYREQILPDLKVYVPPNVGKSTALSEKLIERLSQFPGVVLVGQGEAPKKNLDALLEIHGNMYHEISNQLFPLDDNVKMPRYQRIPHRARGDKRQFPIGRKK
ncbi:hypothetical protein D9M68_18820 [compost metagenome]